MPSLRLVVAHTEQQIADAQRVRWKVYGEEERMLPAAACRSGREIDACDSSVRTCLFLVYFGAEPVGTLRLIESSRNAAAQRVSAWGLELESKFELKGFEASSVPAEVSRYCVLHRFRGTRVTSLLVAGLFAESRRRGVTHWVAAANMQTDSVEDAGIAYRLVKERKLVNPSLCAEPRGDVRPRMPSCRPLYAAEQRNSAARGDLADLELPKVLALFANRMAARYIGPPTYDSYFGVFALPLAADLGDFRLATSRESAPLTEGASRVAYDFGGIRHTPARS